MPLPSHEIPIFMKVLKLVPSGNTLTAEPFFALLFPVFCDMQEGDPAEST